MKGKKSNEWIYVALGITLLFLMVVALFRFQNKPRERFTNAETKSLEYFYMPSCPHCKDFDPVWEDVCSTVSTEKVALRTQKHNLMEDDELGRKYNVNAAPTILLISGDNQVKEYKGPRDVKSIMSFIMDEM